MSGRSGRDMYTWRLEILFTNIYKWLSVFQATVHKPVWNYANNPKLKNIYSQSGSEFSAATTEVHTKPHNWGPKCWCPVTITIPLKHEKTKWLFAQTITWYNYYYNTQIMKTTLSHLVILELRKQYRIPLLTYCQGYTEPRLPILLRRTTNKGFTYYILHTLIHRLNYNTK